MMTELDCCVSTTMETIKSHIDVTTKELLEIDSMLTILYDFLWAENNSKKKDRIEIRSLDTNIVHNRYLAEEIRDKLRVVCERFGCC